MTTYVLKSTRTSPGLNVTEHGLRRIAHGIAIPGPQGPPGTAGGGFVYNQVAPALTWVVNHNLGYRPAGEVYDSGGNEVVAEVQHMSLNQYEVRVNPAMSGFTRAV